MTNIERVGVVGAGTMGHGIAQVAAQAGCETVLFDVTLDAAKQGIVRIRENLEAGIQKGKVTAEQRDQTLSRLRATAGFVELARCQLIVEAIPEDVSLKQSTFKKLSDLCEQDAIFATNTSSLSVTEIAQPVKHPQRVVGLHFFNPVHVMKLVEVVRADRTSEDVVRACTTFVERLGKKAILISDSPGFASSRLGVLLGLEAIRMLETGVGSAEDIDRAMELGYGHPMGPLKLTDLVGLDVRLAIAEYLHVELGSDAFRPPQLLRKMVRAGKLGKKSGQGFYTY